MSKQKNNPKKAPTPNVREARPEGKEGVVQRRALLLPVIPLFFLAVWLWSAVYFGHVFRICREYSFWVKNPSEMQFVLSRSFGSLWYVGRMLLQLFRYPWLGGLLMAFLLSMGSWLLGYAMRLRPRWRWIQYAPALAYMAVLTYHGLDIFFEAETGRILGIPFLTVLVLSIWAVIIRSFSRKSAPAIVGIPRDESPWQNRVQILVLAVGMMCVVGYNEWRRAEVRVVCRLMDAQYEQDWETIQRVARDNADMSNRPMAAYYAMALVHTDQVATRVYDIRLDYDTLHIHGMDWHSNNASAMYIPEGSYHAGLLQTSYHQCMEQMVMTGPTVRLLQLMTKCALMRSEWELARKYLRVLRDVPFEGSFCQRYGAMLNKPDLVNADAEMAKIRLTEPIHDSFENQYQQPTFMGYNLALVEGRSMNALYNSLAVCLYTKVMPDFMARLNPIRGTTPPDNFADGILLCRNKQEGIEKGFTGLNLREPRLQAYMKTIQPYLKDRPRYARELFPRFKGYYPYYYFFGNLKATRKSQMGSNRSSSSGVN